MAAKCESFRRIDETKPFTSTSTVSYMFKPSKLASYVSYPKDKAGQTNGQNL